MYLIQHQQLEGTASWINVLHGIDGEIPDVWMNTPEIPVIPPEVGQETRNTLTLNSNQTAV